MPACEVIGVLEMANKAGSSRFNKWDLEVLMALESTAAIAIGNNRLHEAIVDGCKSIVRALVAAIDAIDSDTCGHSQRVAEYALLGATVLSLSPDELRDIEFGGLLHDIGKIGISASILRKPGRLTGEEWSVVRQHPVIGASIIRGVPFLEAARDLVLCHHERYDGGGYPEGLKGEEIPAGARLIAVADAFDTMTSERSYRAALSVDYAINELYRLSGTQFCPVTVGAFVSGFHVDERKPGFEHVLEPRQLVGRC